MPLSPRLLRSMAVASTRPAAAPPPAPSERPAAALPAAKPVPPRPTARSRGPIWLMIAIVGWAAVAALGFSLSAVSPPRAGFDLELLLGAGRRAAAGSSPYDPAVLAGHVPSAVDLFYSYPPPVAQYLGLFAQIPSPLVLVTWALLAAVGFAAVAILLAGELVPGRRPSWRVLLLTVGLPILAIEPAVLPYTIATLFGNLDALFPLLYGLMLLAVLAPSTMARFGGGGALAIAAVAKVHPASMGIWFLARGLRDRRRNTAAIEAATAASRSVTPRSTSSRSAAPAPSVGRGHPSARAWFDALPAGWAVSLAAGAVGLAMVLLSLAVGGMAPWSDYLIVVRAASSAAVIDVPNIGPAAQIALLAGGGEDAARLLQIAVTGVAVGGTAVAAWFCDDPIESFAWGAVASMVVLPITWFHYPVALLPVALAGWLRAAPAARRDLSLLLVGAGVLGLIAVGLPVVVWVSVGLVLLGVRRSAPALVRDVPLPTLEPSRIVRFPTHGERG